MLFSPDQYSDGGVGLYPELEAKPKTQPDVKEEEGFNMRYRSSR